MKLDVRLLAKESNELGLLKNQAISKMLKEINNGIGGILKVKYFSKSMGKVTLTFGSISDFLFN